MLMGAVITAAILRGGRTAEQANCADANHHVRHLTHSIRVHSPPREYLRTERERSEAD